MVYSKHLGILGCYFGISISHGAWFEHGIPLHDVELRKTWSVQYCTTLGGGGVIKYCLWVFILPHIFLVENEHIIPLHVIHLFLHVQPGDNQKWCVPKTHECPRLSSNTIGKIKNSGQHSYIQMGPLLALLYKMHGYAVSNQATAF